MTEREFQRHSSEQANHSARTQSPASYRIPSTSALSAEAKLQTDLPQYSEQISPNPRSGSIKEVAWARFPSSLVLKGGNLCFRIMHWNSQAHVSQDKGLHQGHMVRNRKRDSLLKLA